MSSRKSGTVGRNNPEMHSILAVFCSSKEPHPPALWPDGRGINISGVDFWHAVEFSRNGSFLRGRFTGPSGLTLRVSSLSDPFGSDSRWRDSALAFPPFGFPASPTLAEAFCRIFHPLRKGARLLRLRSRGCANVLERGAPMQIRGAPLLAVRQTSTTTGRIIGRRR